MHVRCGAAGQRLIFAVCSLMAYGDPSTMRSARTARRLPTAERVSARGQCSADVSGSIQRSADPHDIWRNEFSAAEPEPRVVWKTHVDRERSVEIGSDLFGDLGERQNLHLAAQPAELRVHRISPITGFRRSPLDFAVDRQGVVPVRQPSEAISLLLNRSGLARERIN